ncbi:hypothetical protein AMTR_s00059p00043290 [Amborella trichopoda]|uniref:Uncharacterized protein n=1 Tax=Amborella trichopoda TaxID=13333 RepID=U5CVY2_AMBTC|nr:hypothetical protein AMTR_s00059p00043290 [Amborella trichopoda]
MEEMRCRSLSVERSTSRKGKSKSLILLSESIPSECARFTSYERLSKSMKFEVGEIRSSHRKPSSTSFLSRFFSSFGRGEVKQCEEVSVVKEKREKEKRKWSWRPDPDRRWPVQGW